MTCVHLGLIPDGNRRWSKQNKGVTFDYPGMVVNIVKNFLSGEKEFEVPIKVNEFSMYLLSKDNLQREDNSVEVVENTVDSLDKLMFTTLGPMLEENNISIKFNIYGETHLLSEKFQKRLESFKKRHSNENGTFVINLAIAYDPVLDSERLLKDGIESRRPIDLVIRTGFEKRSSGFFPLQTLYSEWFYYDIFFPDITIDTVKDSLYGFVQRKRNFGK